MSPPLRCCKICTPLGQYRRGQHGDCLYLAHGLLLLVTHSPRTLRIPCTHTPLRLPLGRCHLPHAHGSSQHGRRTSFPLLRCIQESAARLEMPTVERPVQPLHKSIVACSGLECFCNGEDSLLVLDHWSVVFAYGSCCSWEEQKLILCAPSLVSHCLTFQVSGLANVRGHIL